MWRFLPLYSKAILISFNTVLSKFLLDKLISHKISFNIYFIITEHCFLNSFNMLCFTVLCICSLTKFLIGSSTILNTSLSRLSIYSIRLVSWSSIVSITARSILMSLCFCVLQLKLRMGVFIFSLTAKSFNLTYYIQKFSVWFLAEIRKRYSHIACSGLPWIILIL